MAAVSVRPSRFDRSSWITLSVALAILVASLAVVMASYDMPMDGWETDRGAWGRYSNPIYLEAEVDSVNSELQAGDILLAVEGVPFEQLEAAAAALAPKRPAHWQFGATLRYTVLRQGLEVDAAVTLVRPRLLILYHPKTLLENPVLLTFPVFLLICVLVFALRPRERAAQLLFLFGFAFFNENFLSMSAVSTGVADLFSLATYWPRIILSHMLWSFIIVPLLVHLFFIFPVKKGLLRRFPRLIPALLYGACAAASLLFVAWNASGRYASGTVFISILTLPCLVLVALSQIHNWFTMTEPVARMQARWVALGGLVGIIGPVSLWIVAGGLSASVSFWVGLVYLLLALALPLSLAIAILRYRLWDIDVIIRRTLQYTLLTGVLALIYFGGVVLLQALLSPLTGDENSPLVTVLTTLGIAALFNPLRTRVQAFIDRRLYRKKYNAEQSLARFAAAARSEVDMDRLADALLGVVEETMRPERVEIRLKS
jgi:hypothetical protein